MRFVSCHISIALVLLVLHVGATTLRGQPTLPSESSEANLIAVLQSNAPLFDKAKACQRLAIIGTKESVPVLANLLSAEPMAHYARYALEPIPDPAVDDALRNALNELDGTLLVGVIHSVGVRGDTKAVEQLKGMLNHANIDVATASAAALGRIATPEAVAALGNALGRPESLRSAVANACLAAADAMRAAGKPDAAVALFDSVSKAEVPKHLQMAALAGAIRAQGAAAMPRLAKCLQSDDPGAFRVGLQMAHELGGPEVASLLAEQVKAPESADSLTDIMQLRQVLLIRALGNLGQKAALPAVLDAARADAVDIRHAAIVVLGQLGDASAVPVLLEAAAGEPAVAQAARQSLVGLEGKEVDRAIAAAMPGAEGEQRVVLIELARHRGIAALAPALMQAADADDPKVAEAAVRALGATIGPDDLPALVQRLVRPESAAIATAAKESLKTAVLRMPDRNAAAAALLAAMPTAPAPAQVDVLDVLGVVGGERALAGVAAAARTGSNDLQDAATRVLGEWMTPDVAPVLLDLARTGPENYQVRCLRGYIRVFRQLGLPDNEKLAMAGKAFELAGRDDERILVLEAMARIPEPRALDMAVAHVNNPTLRQAACRAAVAIAEHLVKDHPAAVADAMAKVVAAGPDDGTVAKARQWLNEAKKSTNSN